MTDLSQDELTILLIAAKGESMIPIGRWQAPTESLLARGYLKSHKHPGDPTGHFNNRITAAGKAAVERADQADAEDLVMVSQSVSHEQTKIRAHAEQIAVQLVDLAEASHRLTGDAKVEALEKWSRLIIKRALDLLR